MEPGVFIEAERIERLDADTYRMTGARFTSCAQPNPRWRFTTSSATIHRDDKIVAKNVVFRVKSVPTFYLPYFRYPLKEDQRATGLLSPRFGYSELRGFAVGAGFFWATGRSHDQTFLLDYYRRFGTGLTHELRYLRRGGSGGRFRSNVVQRTDVEARDFDLDWSGVQDLPGSFRASLNVRRFSSTTFQQAYQDDLDSASIRRQGGSLNIQGRMLGNNVQLVTELNETFFGDELTRSIRRLPALRISRSPRRVGRTGIVLRYEARAERLSQGVQDLTAPYNRFDIAPEISRPMSTSFLQVNPRLGFRYTHYSGTLTDEGLDGPALDRPVFEATVNVRGPTFSRVFTTPGFGYSPRLKHQIGPEFNWIYRTAVDDFDLIPKFDGIDHLLGTNQLSYGLVQRVMAKRPAGKTGKLRTHELFLWRIFQTYYVQISEGQNEFDPNFSSAAFGADGVPAHYSPIKSRARFTPARGIRLQHDIEYDVNFNQFRVQGLSLRWSFGSGDIGGSWSRAERLSEVAEERVATRNTIRGAAQLAVAGRSLVLSASTDYDLVRDSMIRSSARLRYSVQCCGLMVEAIRVQLQRSRRDAVPLCGRAGEHRLDRARRRSGSGRRNLAVSVLVTGATGFVASHMFEHIGRVAPTLRRFGLVRPGLADGLASLSGVTAIEADLTEPARVRAAVAEARPERVIHLAAHSSVHASWSDPAACFATNVLGLGHLLDALREASLSPRVLVVGSADEYGAVGPQDLPLREDTPPRPRSPYAASKVAQGYLARRYARTFGMDVVCTRTFPHTGPGRGEVFAESSFARQVAEIEAGIVPAVVRAGKPRRRSRLHGRQRRRASVLVATRSRRARWHVQRLQRSRCIDARVARHVARAERRRRGPRGRPESAATVRRAGTRRRLRQAERGDRLESRDPVERDAAGPARALERAGPRGGGARLAARGGSAPRRERGIFRQIKAPGPGIPGVFWGFGNAELAEKIRSRRGMTFATGC